MFTDRQEAGKQLAQKLEAYRGKDAVVFALPRGGVIPGYEIAKVLGVPLDIIAVRKIGYPGNPEYAIGAIDGHGTTVLNETETAAVDKTWLAAEAGRQQQEAERRSTLYRGGKKPASAEGRVAILVDDGIATGLTMRLAVRSVKMQKPKEIIVAIPVAPPEAVEALYREGADEVLLLEPPEEFLGAVGAHYIQFDQVGDDEVIRLMRAI
ncbi:hypothetical protein A3D71_02490 [Candidatus Kaiserbacteria bacterium RIFCSPHIGHO2_02_FULL_55_20]|uniref:Phosphoribosyltransferase domain-containing protein n=1 Tax=Candidatus Kaiserbacteria bacterium RIFCSPHIGHO2_02_FULL_55_20 TaxID=1798497 RepID=A0A1F6DYB2_9BACT|nr:MAG: hypothetical protein A2680_01960 [Candidatus Kaiserbacteria bacterium RIFCSPHIGHO2_01_FULL_55_37]OGG66415.1 MAG: hypothetical protein A3D71_02490 [Candidatus Kaiserbacteria bacterium RIFCSPHIGHO2_02_FULL_55_20]